MKLIVDTSKKHVMVSREPVEKNDQQSGRQKVERGTGRPMWSTQVFVQDNDGGEVITVTTAGVRPEVAVGQIVAVVNLEALPWATNGRSGVAFRAESISSAPGVHSVKTA
jgi:hypothetical protein